MISEKRKHLAKKTESRPVQINKMKPLGAGLRPRFRYRDRIGSIGHLPREIPLMEPHDLTINQVNSRINNHVFNFFAGSETPACRVFWRQRGLSATSRGTARP